jgi:hypothetical protein
MSYHGKNQGFHGFPCIFSDKLPEVGTGKPLAADRGKAHLHQEHQQAQKVVKRDGCRLTPI